MSSFWKSFVLAAVLIGLTCTQVASAGQKDGAFIVNDLAAAKALAKKTGKPLFIVFRCER